MAVSIPTAKIGAATVASYDGGTTTTGAFSVTASGRNTAVATAQLANVALDLAGSGVSVDAEIETGANVTATVGSPAQITASGAVTVLATTAAGVTTSAIGPGR